MTILPRFFCLFTIAPPGFLAAPWVTAGPSISFATRVIAPQKSFSVKASTITVMTEAVVQVNNMAIMLD